MGGGERIRFLQARYNLESNVLRRFTRDATPILNTLLFGSLNAAEASLKARDFAALDYFCEAVTRFPVAKDVEAVGERIFRSKEDFFDSRQVRDQHLYGSLSEDRLELLSMIELDYLAVRMGLATVSRVSLRTPTLLQIAPIILAHLRRGGVFALALPDHQMLLQSDPKRNTYRFFDPNLGLVRRCNAPRLVEGVVKYIDSNFEADSELLKLLELPVKQTGEIITWCERCRPAAGWW